MSRSDRRRLADQPLNLSIQRVERLSPGFRPLEAVDVTHDSLDGERRLHVRRELLRARQCAVVLAHDPALDCLVVIRQFRIGAALATPNAAPLELPAGLVDGDEKPVEAAIRELREETGLAVQAIAPAFSLLTSPGLSDELAHFFLAIVDASRLDLRGGLAEEDEDILPIAAPVGALIEAADDGFIANGLMFAALQWFDRKGRPLARTLTDSLEP